jgi:murein L,D-transpeptidase YcbB/YkuD
MKPKLFPLGVCGLLLFSALSGCTTRADGNDNQDKIKTVDTESEASSSNREILSHILEHKGRLNDSTTLFLSSLTDSFYRGNGSGNVWSRSKKWLPVSDSLVGTIRNAERFGLFPRQYHLDALEGIFREIAADSSGDPNGRKWAEADILLTDAGLHLLNDLHYGRMNYSIVHDAGPSKKLFLLRQLTRIINEGQLTTILADAEPHHAGYLALKAALPRFLDSMDRKSYTYVRYPFKKSDEKDSLNFIRNMKQRLFESRCLEQLDNLPDSARFSEAIKKYQRSNKLKPTGSIDAALIKNMNTSDAERFRMIAVTLDRYKQLPSEMPEKHIWVNLPAYRLQLWERDSLALESKIICGKPETRTPTLSSELTDMVIYPTWTVPNSIITKQYLPKLKNNPRYLSRLGLQLFGTNGKPIDPTSVNWNKYSKGIPYKIMQSSGDRNALGVMKFNFNNEYAVYLHDTNQRYLFKRTSRAFSHGCVRVEKWDSLAYFIARNDSINLKAGDTLRYSTDSLKLWLGQKQYRKVLIDNKIALFISYFSCEAQKGKIIFHEDIYGEDRRLREQYFTD